MTGSLQKGIYYERDRQIGNSFCIIFLKIGKETKVSELSSTLTNLWSRLHQLEKGQLKDLDVVKTKRTTGNLSKLIGYSHAIFSMDDIKKNLPKDFRPEWDFIPPKKTGGGPIVTGSNIHYPTEITDNPILDNEIAIQIIANDEFHTHRALVEVWKELENSKGKRNQDSGLHIAKYFTGFHTVNGRSLIGFHDGISNIRSSERLESIAIKQNNERNDSWTVNGTYLTFMRVRFSLRSWESLTTEKQELLIGRKKITGCPIIGLDKKGVPIAEKGCPVQGTFEVIDKGNERSEERRVGKEC